MPVQAHGYLKWCLGNLYSYVLENASLPSTKPTQCPILSRLVRKSQFVLGLTPVLRCGWHPSISLQVFKDWLV